ncbi:MAG TPA: endopeptidase La [Ruminococcaceae bacterium]|nr:endopeptidase La [Oscillospiraceae bacterium]
MEFYFDEFALPMVALRGLVVFPGAVVHFDVGRKQSISAIKEAMTAKKDIFLVAQKNAAQHEIDLYDLYNIGTVCEIKQLVRMPSGDAFRVVVEGKYRAALCGLVSKTPFFTASVMRTVESTESGNSLKTEAMVRHAKVLFEEYAEFSAPLAPDVAIGVTTRKDAGELADFIAANIPIEYALKQQVLEQSNKLKRLETLCVILLKEIDLLRVESEIDSKVQQQMDENQREYYLREQMKAISAELNGGESSDDEAEKYRSAIKKIGFKPEDEEKLLTECDRLAKMQSSSPESAVIRNYLDEVLALPWNKYTKDNLDIKKARKILERDHYGLDEVKDRILELLAVRKLAPDIKGQIICLAGPPGVGKTSVAKSLAHAMNRKYARISLGGVRDEAEIRGHRRTYIGAMEGNIMDALKRTKSANPLILLDEIDKLSSDYKGDPSSALLEALDPEQNNAFRDHYIDIPFDLSKVLFVTTANDLTTIPAPLRDRMEIIELYSYTFNEKFNIAKKHLVPKQLKQYGLKASQLKIRDDALTLIIEGYTKEAGVRTCERVISKVLRKEAVKFAEGFDGKITVKASDLEELLGPRKFKDDSLVKEDRVGVVNGLAWTSVGGEMLQIEALVTDGTGKLELTGSLGDVMKESAKTAYSFMRSVTDEYSIPEDFYKSKDVHLHFPEGAVPKDGPSAGIGITTALASALSGRKVNANIAMTGEVTLTGRVLAIGGLKEKSMAAYKNGIKTVIIPEDNMPDIKQFDSEVKKAITFVPVSDVNEVLSLALVEDKEKKTRKTDKKLAMPEELANNQAVWQQS